MITLDLKLLEDSEKEEIKSAQKVLKDKLKWSYKSNGRVVQSTSEVWIRNIDSLSFRKQYPMELSVKIIVPSLEYIFFYWTKSGHQIIRMYHSSPGHDDATQEKIAGKHKHYFVDNRLKRAYPVHDIGDGPIAALKDFCIEENIDYGNCIVPYQVNSRLTEWEGVQ